MNQDSNNNTYGSNLINPLEYKASMKTLDLSNYKYKDYSLSTLKLISTIKNQ